VIFLWTYENQISHKICMNLWSLVSLWCVPNMRWERSLEVVHISKYNPYHQLYSFLTQSNSYTLCQYQKTTSSPFKLMGYFWVKPIWLKMWSFPSIQCVIWGQLEDWSTPKKFLHHLIHFSSKMLKLTLSCMFIL